MEKHLLLTVSEQQSGNYGVQFVGHFFSNKKDIKLTLFYAAPKPSAVWEGERTHESVSQSEQYAKQYENKGRKALEAAKKEIVRLGLGPSSRFEGFQRLWISSKKGKRTFMMRWFWVAGACHGWRRLLMKA